MMILIVVLIGIGLGVAVGSFWTFLAGLLIGVGVALVLLVAVGGFFAARHPAHRDDGAPARGSPV